MVVSHAIDIHSGMYILWLPSAYGVNGRGVTDKAYQVHTGRYENRELGANVPVLYEQPLVKSVHDSLVKVTSKLVA